MRETIDKGIVIAPRDVVKILDTDYFSEFLRFCKVLRRDGAQSNVPNQSLLLELDKRGQRLLDGAFRRFNKPTYAEVDNVDGLQAEIPKIVMNRIDEFLTRQSRYPRCVRTATSA